MNIREKLTKLGYYEWISSPGKFGKSFSEHLPGSFIKELFISIILKDNKIADAYVTAGNNLYQATRQEHMDFIKRIYRTLEDDLKELNKNE